MITLSEDKVNAIRDLFNQILSMYRLSVIGDTVDMSDDFVEGLAKESQHYQAQLEGLLKEENHGR